MMLQEYYQEESKANNRQDPALNLIHEAMLNSWDVSVKASEEHLAAFTLQMWDKLGVRQISIREPNLPYELARLTPIYLRVLERFENTVLKVMSGKKDCFWDETEVPPTACGGRLGGGNFYDDVDDLELKAIDPKEPLEPQIAERLKAEENRHKIRVKQKLDEERQKKYGLKIYIWRTQGDDKVRESHAANDGKKFSWDSSLSTGHPGHDYNCRCWAEPTADGSDKAKTPTSSEPDPKILEAIILLVISMNPLGRAFRIAYEIAKRVLGDKLPKPPEKPAQPPAPKPEAPSPPSAPKPRLDDSKTWPKPPVKGGLKEGAPSRAKPASRGEKSLYDEYGGEWRYSPEDKYHNPHWDYKPAGRSQEWQNIPIDNKPILK